MRLKGKIVVAPHEGWDGLSKSGDIFSSGPGIVEYAKRHPQYGKTVIVNHGFGIKTIYAHLSEIKVKKNQPVTTYTLVGIQGGSDGIRDDRWGSHLHFGVGIRGSYWTVIDPGLILE
jgi:murein DD-endopeptidase MepM/ murein hydrolase activator NlpD